MTTDKITLTLELSPDDASSLLTQLHAALYYLEWEGYRSSVHAMTDRLTKRLEEAMRTAGLKASQRVPTVTDRQHHAWFLLIAALRQRYWASNGRDRLVEQLHTEITAWLERQDADRRMARRARAMNDEALMQRRRAAELFIKMRLALEIEMHHILATELDGKPGGLDEISARLSIPYRRIWADLDELEAAIGLSHDEMEEARHRVDPEEHYPGIDDDDDPDELVD